MWERARLKERAKKVFKASENYWLFVVAGLIFSITNGSGSAYGRGFNSSYSSYDEEVITAVLSIFLVIGIFSIGLSIFVFNPLAVGVRRFSLNARNGKANLGDIGFAFSGGKYMNVVKIMFLMKLKIILWSLLFVIPGIVKSYEYYAIPFLLADNPELNTERVFELSKKMTDGEKMNIFVLELSFIGWIILGVISCGMGLVFYVNPYMLATHAELYAVLRNSAMHSGMTGSSELMGDFYSVYDEEEETYSPYQMNNQYQQGYGNQTNNQYQQGYGNQTNNQYQQGYGNQTNNQYPQQGYSNQPNGQYPQQGYSNQPNGQYPQQGDSNHSNNSGYSDLL